MTDVLIYQSIDDGEINLDNGVIQLSSGLDSSVYLSLFGGAEDWWGNVDEGEQVRRYTAKTQGLIETLNPSSANLLRMEDAVSGDLQWMIDEKVASSIEVEVTIPELNKLKIVVNITAEGNESQFEYTENWKAAA